MNRRLSKRIRNHAADIQLDWVKSLLPDGEAAKVNPSNLIDMLPKQTHVWGLGIKYNSVFGIRHVTKKLKQLLRLFPNKAVEDFTLDDVNWKIQQRRI
jgi:hypothetical protein